MWRAWQPIFDGPEYLSDLFPSEAAASAIEDPVAARAREGAIARLKWERAGCLALKKKQSEAAAELAALDARKSLKVQPLYGSTPQQLYGSHYGSTPQQGP